MQETARMKGAPMMSDKDWAEVFGLEKWYQSNTTGKIVPSIFEVFAQVFESLFKYHTIDLKWRVIWLAGTTEA